MYVQAYLIFVIFSTQADFKPSKFYTQKRVKFRRQKLPRDKTAWITTTEQYYTQSVKLHIV